MPACAPRIAPILASGSKVHYCCTAHMRPQLQGPWLCGGITPWCNHLCQGGKPKQRQEHAPLQTRLVGWEVQQQLLQVWTGCPDGTHTGDVYSMSSAAERQGGEAPLSCRAVLHEGGGQLAAVRPACKLQGGDTGEAREEAGLVMGGSKRCGDVCSTLSTERDRCHDLVDQVVCRMAAEAEVAAGLARQRFPDVALNDVERQLLKHTEHVLIQAGFCRWKRSI